MDVQELNRHLVNIVQEYGSKWNSIEDRIYKQHEQEEAELREQYTGDEYHYAKRTDWHEEFSGLISPIFDEYCTDKKKVYGGKSRQSFGFPDPHVEQIPARSLYSTLQCEGVALLQISKFSVIKYRYRFIKCPFLFSQSKVEQALLFIGIPIYFISLSTKARRLTV